MTSDEDPAPAPRWELRFKSLKIPAPPRHLPGRSLPRAQQGPRAWVAVEKHQPAQTSARMSILRHIHIPGRAAEVY